MKRICRIVIAIALTAIHAWGADGKAEDLEAKKNFLEGGGFGAGLWVTKVDGRVKEASIVNNIVRVTDDDDLLAAPMLETHYLFMPDTYFPNVWNTADHDDGFGVDPGNWGVGPMVVTQISGENIIDAVGFGMVLALRKGTKVEDKQGFNLGAGYILDLDAKQLAPGFSDGAAAPAGAKEVGFTKSNEGGFFISFSWNFY